MKIKPILLIIISFTILQNVVGQSILLPQTPLKKEPSLLQKSAIPLSLITLGLIANNSHFEKKLQVDLHNKIGNNFQSNLDDFTQYLPIGEMYLADMLGIKAKNHWFDQTKYLFISNLITATLTHSLKRTTNKHRPNGAPHAFPSGHTSFAFTNAAVLFQEFHDTAPLFAYSGYVFATTTGVYRMFNNKHWLSDVLLGAGIGILVTELVYHFEPLRHFNPFRKSKHITFTPQITNSKIGFYFSYCPTCARH